MARVTYVKKAQARFATVPVLDESGQPKSVAVTRKDGSPKTTKKGKEIVRRLTVADKTRPLPNYTCGKCRSEIKVGDPYKWIKPKSGPYGGRLLVRCAQCPTWQVWDYSSSLSAQVSRITHEASETLYDVENSDDVTSILETAADEIESLAEEKRESASNIEDGFGHSTYLSEELEQTADDLEQWASDIREADVPELPEPEEGDCEECDGTGKIENPDFDPDVEDTVEDVDCDQCDGDGVWTPEEPTSDQIDEWRSEVQDATSILDECPI